MNKRYGKKSNAPQKSEEENRGSNKTKPLEFFESGILLPLVHIMNNNQIADTIPREVTSMKHENESLALKLQESL